MLNTPLILSLFLTLPLFGELHRPEEILEYWFGPLSERVTNPMQRSSIWFMGGEEIDREIRDKFSEDRHQAAYGHLDHWAETPRGRLALLILLDQFSRNIYRDSPLAFMTDALALHLALEGIRQEEDLSLTPIERAFFYLPLEHAEDLPVQDLSVEKFTQLVDSAPPEYKEQFELFLHYAHLHREDIRKHGLFPYRDQPLAR